MDIRNAIVSGAGSGVGLACVRRLLERGWRVAALGRDVNSIRAAVDHGDGRLFPVKVDIGISEQCATAIGEAVGHLGDIDAFLHFAALWSGTRWDQSEPSEWDRMNDVNIKGTFFLTQAVARHMVARGRGSIVLTTSDSVNVGGVAGGPAYVASKAASVGLTHSLAKALGPKGIRVNAVSPGVIDTPMTRDWPQHLKDNAKAQTPLGRLAEASEVADVACFLASDEARFLCGEIVEVNGGSYFK